MQFNQIEHLRFVCVETNNEFGLYYHFCSNSHYYDTHLLCDIIASTFEDPCIAT